MEKDPRPEKVAVVDEVRERLDSTSATILAEYRGLNVDQLARLRGDLRNIGGEFKVYKNTLVRLAARELELELEEWLTGPTAMAFVSDRPDGTPGDAVDVAKVLKDFGKENPALVVKGGVLGDRILTADDARALADVEPREVLLAKLAGGMAAPMQKFAGLLQALPRNFAYGLKALIDQGGAPGAPVDEAPATEAPVDEAPADEAPADEAPATEAPATEAPAEEAPTADEAAETTNDETPDTNEPENSDTAADETAASADTEEN